MSCKGEGSQELLMWSSFQSQHSARGSQLSLSQGQQNSYYTFGFSNWKLPSAEIYPCLAWMCVVRCVSLNKHWREELKGEGFMQLLVSEVSISTLTPLLLDLRGKQSTMLGAVSCLEQGSQIERQEEPGPDTLVEWSTSKPNKFYLQVPTSTSSVISLSVY